MSIAMPPFTACATLSFVLLLSACVVPPIERTDELPRADDRARAALVEALRVLDGTGHGDPKGLAPRLSATAAAVDGEPAVWLLTLAPMVGKLADAPQSLTAADFRAVASIADRVGAAYPDDFEAQLAAAATVFYLHSPPGHAPAEGEAIAAELTTPDGGSTPGPDLERAEGLVERFPHQARAHAHLGLVLSTTGGDELDAMQRFARCLELDPDAAVCASSLDALADSYTRPRCTRLTPGAFAMRAASERPSPGSERLVVGKDTVYADPLPAFGADDVLAMYEQPAAAGATPSASLWLTPSAAARFARFTRASIGRRLVVELAGHPVALPKIMSAVDSGRVRITAPGATLGDICERVEVPQLPAALGGLTAAVGSDARLDAMTTDALDQASHPDTTEGG
jgi:hypothetical protein